MLKGLDILTRCRIRFSCGGRCHAEPVSFRSVPFRPVPFRRRWRRLAAIGTLALAGCATAPAAYPPGVAGPPVHSPVTLWSFLGVDRLVVHHRLKHERNMAWLGQHFPDMEPKPPLMLNASPEAAASPSVAVHSAAHVLAAEQQAPQKIKAIEAVAQVGAAAYPQVEIALLAGMEDRSPKVRLATVEAILKTAGDRCDPCDVTGNCTPTIRHRLWVLGYGVGEDGCPLECSAPVRRVARLALDACGGPLPAECPPPQSLELPSVEIIEQSQAVPAPALSGPAPSGPALPGQ